MTYASALVFALLLDAIFGEPHWLWNKIPHPAVLIGRGVDQLDRALNQGENRKIKGTLTVVLLITLAILFATLIKLLPFTTAIEIVLAAMLLAQRSLCSHVQDVADAMRLSLASARSSVARIVGRDTSEMDQTSIARGAIESAAENLSDAVIAPALWFLLAGFPGLLIYKVINTADSMIGYKNDRYGQFGWAAARLDDLLNWAPARLTAILIALAHFRPDIARVVQRDAPLHRSPNAGWPEAAIAAILNISLAGPRSYGGEIRDFPYVYPEGKSDLTATDVDRTVTALWRSWALWFCIVLLLAVV